METEILDESQLDLAAELLRQGEIVAFPTDTVYGVACVYDNEAAIAKLKQAKGRPESKPFPLMVADKEHIKLVAEVDERAEKIIDAWMPGALTIVLKKKAALPDSATNGAATVAIRMADDAFVIALIKRVGKPLLVTSANLSGEPSLCCYRDVYEKLNGRIAAMISKDSQSATASTIVDLSGDAVKLLRNGPISLDDLLSGLMYDENK